MLHLCDSYLVEFGSQFHDFVEEQWLSGRMLDPRSRGCRFGPHQSTALCLLSKTFYIPLSTGSTQEEPFRHNQKIIDWDVKNE